MTWVLVAVTAWLVVSAAVAVVIARAIRLADRRSSVERLGAGEQPTSRPPVVGDFVRSSERRPAPRRAGRR